MQILKRLSSEIWAAIITVVGGFLAAVIQGWLTGTVGFTTLIGVIAAVVLLGLVVILLVKFGWKITLGLVAAMVFLGAITYFFGWKTTLGLVAASALLGYILRFCSTRLYCSAWENKSLST
jgi:hypothetical protein